jgi:hypothetical protein
MITFSDPLIFALDLFSDPLILGLIIFNILRFVSDTGFLQSQSWE